MADEEKKGSASVPPIAGGDTGAAQADVQSLNQEIPAVGQSSRKTYVLVIVFAVFALYFIYNTFILEDKKPVDTGPKQATETEGFGKTSSGQIVNEPAGTTPGTIEEPVILTPPPPPPAPEVAVAPPPPVPPTPAPQVRVTPPPLGQTGEGGFPSLNPFNPRNVTPTAPRRFSTLPSGSREVDQREQERLRASMLIGGGGNAIGPEASGLQLADGDFVPQDTAAAKVRVTLVGDPYRTVLQGKILDAVLETAINSDLPGVLRALVSRDIYAEKGRSILVPKGSRLIGSYNTDIKRGQARIYIIWNRIIRPDGIDIAVDSPAMDLLGRSGVEGEVDNKYLEIFSNSLLLSTVTVGFAAVTEAITDSGNIEQGETGSGNATTSGSVTDIATLEAVNNFSDTAQTMVEDLINVAPTVTIDQGTQIKVFVNRDIRFPKNVLSPVALVE